MKNIEVGTFHLRRRLNNRIRKCYVCKKNFDNEEFVVVSKRIFTLRKTEEKEERDVFSVCHLHVKASCLNRVKCKWSNIIFPHIYRFTKEEIDELKNNIAL